MKNNEPTSPGADVADTNANPDNSRRIRDAAKARSTFARHWKDSDARRKQMAQTRNQLEGGLPFDPDELRRNGMAWMTNANFRDSEAAFNRTYLPYWKMVHDVPNKIAVTCHTKAPHGGKWAKAIAECFDLFIDDWGVDYFAQFMMFTQDFVKFGPGYVMWDDPKICRFKYVRTEHVVLPKNAKANTESWEIVSFKRDMTVSDLWKKIRNAKTEARSEHVGWKPKAVRDAIRLCKGDGKTCDNTDWSTIQDEITSNDIAISDEWAPIQVIYQFVKDHDDKIGLRIFTENESVKDYLYEQSEHADKFSHVIGAVFYDVGVAGLIHTIKGFAIKNYNFSVMLNRSKSRMMDAASIAMAMNFEKTQETPDEAPPIESYGAVNIFPQGLRQMSVYPNLETAQNVINTLTQNQSENNGIYRDPSKQIAETETARQAVILANLSEEIGAATSSIYLSQIGESFFGETLRRLMASGNTDPDAVKFMRRLSERGVPAEIGKVELTVKTGANPGTAGAALRDMIFKELLSLARMPGVNLRWILEQYFANKLGTQSVDKVLLPEGADSAPMQRRAAMMENAHFGQGIPLPVDPADSHFEHLEEHLKPLEQIVGKAKQSGQQPEPDHLVLLQVAFPHIDAHFELLKADETMKDAYGQIWPKYSEIKSIANGIFTRLAKEQEQQPQQA
jgi:hypothetical protein